MNNLKLKILPQEWIKAYNVLRILSNVSNYTSLKILSLTILVTSLEAVSLTLLMPLLELINNKELVISEDNNSLTNKIIAILNYISFPVSFTSLSILVAIIVFFRQCFSFGLSRKLAKIKADNNKVLRKKIFENTFLSSPNSIEALGTGSYVELMTNQTSIASSYLVYLIKYISVLLLFAFYISIAFFMSPIITIIAIFIAIFFLIFANIIINKIKMISKKNVKDLKYFAKYLSECFSSWKIIKLSNSYSYENNRNNIWVNQIAEQNFQVEFNLAKSNFIISILFMMLLILILNLGITISSIELSMLVMFSIMCLRLLPIILALVSIQTRITVSAESLYRLLKVFTDLKNNKEVDKGKISMSIKKGIFLENVSFKYPESSKYIFRNFSAVIPYRKFTSISGNSGAGKSTLLDLISRIYNKYDGKISLDNISIKNFKLADYRNNISLLPQVPFIYDDTVLSNIRYGNENLKQDEIIKVSKLANAHEFINKLSRGYNTILGERGSKLSGGQVQRIVLARILASKAKIIILDEPTSNLDYNSSNKIISALKKIKNTNEYTLIIVSHDKKIIELGDKIINISTLD